MWSFISFFRNSSIERKVFPSATKGINKITSKSFLALGFVKISGYFDRFKRFQVTEVTLPLLTQFSSVAVVSDSLRPHEPQHARPPCPSHTPRVHSNPCPLSWWCYPTISYSVIPFSSCLQAFLASRSFQMSQLFTSGGQSIGVSASTSVLPMNTQDWSPLGWTGWISLQSKGLKSLLQHHSSKASILWCSAFFIVQLTSWSGPITSWQIDGETETLFFGAPKLLQMVTTAMKLKDACSLEEKLWPT